MLCITSQEDAMPLPPNSQCPKGFRTQTPPGLTGSTFLHLAAAQPEGHLQERSSPAKALPEPPSSIIIQGLLGLFIPRSQKRKTRALILEISSPKSKGKMNLKSDRFPKPEGQAKWEAGS